MIGIHSVCPIAMGLKVITTPSPFEKMLEENAGAVDVASCLTQVVTTELLITANPEFDGAIAAKVVAIHRQSD
jgi:hypothetical protein